MKGLTTDGPCSSRETPTMVKPLSAYFFWIAINPGISARQGGHQVAQKSRMITFPLKSESFTSFPRHRSIASPEQPSSDRQPLIKHPPKRKQPPPTGDQLFLNFVGPYLTLIEIM